MVHRWHGLVRTPRFWHNWSHCNQIVRCRLLLDFTLCLISLLFIRSLCFGFRLWIMDFSSHGIADFLSLTLAWPWPSSWTNLVPLSTEQNYCALTLSKKTHKKKTLCARSPLYRYIGLTYTLFALMFTQELLFWLSDKYT